MNKFFKLYSNCITVKGARRGTICDLQRQRIKIVPNLLVDILEKLNSTSILEVKASYNDTHNDGIDQYLTALVEQDFGFYTGDPQMFPNMQLEWDSPFEISNAIIDFDNKSLHSIEKIVNELSALGCNALMIRYFDPIKQEDLEQDLNLILNSRINAVSLVVPFSQDLLGEIHQIYLRYPFLRNVTFYASDVNKFYVLEDIDVRITLTKLLVSEESCGVVDQSLFTINFQHFTESQNHNSCLNRKLGIDRKGNIKNCPSLKESFGNVRTTSILDVVRGNSKFKALWQISKDKILVCKDCEFRHVCTDCRAFVANEDTKTGKPSKCMYDPYQAKWLN